MSEAKCRVCKKTKGDHYVVGQDRAVRYCYVTAGDQRTWAPNKPAEPSPEVAPMQDLVCECGESIAYRPYTFAGVEREYWLHTKTWKRYCHEGVAKPRAAPAVAPRETQTERGIPDLLAEIIELREKIAHLERGR